MTYCISITRMLLACSIKIKLWCTSCGYRKLRRIKQNNVNLCTYMGISSHKVWLFTSLPCLSFVETVYLSRDRERTHRQCSLKIKVIISGFFFILCLIFFHQTNKNCQRKTVKLIKMFIFYPFRWGPEVTADKMKHV